MARLATILKVVSGILKELMLAEDLVQVLNDSGYPECRVVKRLMAQVSLTAGAMPFQEPKSFPSVSPAAL